MKFPHLFRKTEADKVFTVVKKILHHNGAQLNQRDRFRLKSEALAFRSTLLYRLLMNRVPDDMQREIIENAKDQMSLNYYRAILADRRLLEEEVLLWAESDVKMPPPDMKKPGVDTQNNSAVK